VAWRQNKQGKGKTKAEKDLSLNNLVQFQENGCRVCTVEATEGTWGRLGPLWESFHRTGMSRRALGRSTLMVVMFNGRPTDSDRITMQWLRRINVVHAYMTSSSTLPHVITVHKQVEMEMEDGSKPPHKFTNLCREVMGLTSPTADGPPVPLFDAIIPIVSGQQNGSATITYRTDNKAAAELIRKIHRSVAGWFYGYWIQHYKLGMVKKLMESFDIDTALLA
jgi:hypothetical protein